MSGDQKRQKTPSETVLTKPVRFHDLIQQTETKYVVKIRTNSLLQMISLIIMSYLRCYFTLLHLEVKSYVEYKIV